MRKRSFELTEDQGFAVLASCVSTIAAAATIAHVMDEQDKRAVEDLRSATAEIAKGMGMTLNDLANFAAAGGSPSPETLAFFRRRDGN
jgi:hypothetical protein